MKAKWTGFKGGDTELAMNRLGWVAMGESSLGYDDVEMIVMPTGWRVIAERVNEDPVPVALLSDIVDDVITGYCTTVAMAAITNGKGWDIDYDCGRQTPMKVSGDPPAAFATALAKAEGAAARETGPVDHMYDVPMQVSKAICGYHPEEAPLDGAVPWTVERQAKGGLGRAQEERRQAWASLTSRIRAEFIPHLGRFGFEPEADHPDRRPGDSDVFGFLRRRGENVDAISLLWGVDHSGPQITLNFMTRTDPSINAELGRAFTRFTPGPSLFQRLKGVKPPSLNDDVDRVLKDAEPLLAAVDKFLVDGTAHPDIEPPRYFGRRS